MRRVSREEAIAALWRGDVVAVPTDTVYGVAGRWSDPAAVERLFATKRRPRDVALPVLVRSLDDVGALGVHWDERADRLARHFWPGALTIVVDAEESSALRVGATSSLGVRAPRHEELAAVLAACGPLAVTSANEHGQAPCTTADEVLASDWGAPLAGVLDAGRCDGTVSTVVRVSRDGWRLRRRGAVSPEALAEVLGPESTDDDN